MREWGLDVEHGQCGIDLQDGLPKLLDPRFADDILFFHVLRFGCGHRTVHQNGLHQLDVACRKFLRAVVRPPSNIDWSRPWHEILPEWNGRFTLLEVVRCMEASLLIFNVESNRVTSSAQWFSMLLWSVLCENGRENASIMPWPWLITDGWEISGMRMIWCYMPVLSQVFFFILAPFFSRWVWLELFYWALVEMIETLSWELRQTSLQFNAAKSKIFTTKQLDHPMYVEVSQDLVHVLHEGSSRKYLGRHIPGNLKQRGCVELHHRKTIAWAKFNKHPSDRTYKQTRECEIAPEIHQCCCHVSHDFQCADVGIDESAVRKHWRITAQNVAINCWVGSTKWRGLVWHDASNESQAQCGFGTLPYSTMDGPTCQTPISLCCQDSIGAILVINCWTLDLHNWLAGELWQYAVSQAWTSTGK